MSLSTEQERRLLSNIKKWARILDESARALSSNDITKRFREYDFSSLTPDQFRQVRSSVFSVPADAHMVAISLRQIDEYARELESSSLWSGAIAHAGTAFRTLLASEEARNLRDVVEHGAEYVAGRGRKPELVQDPDADWPSVLIIDGKVTRIAVFGRSYEVKPLILAAIQFVRVLPRGNAGGESASKAPNAAPPNQR